MAEVKVLVEVIGGPKMLASVDTEATAEATAAVLSELAERPLVDDKGKARNWKIFAPGKRGNIIPLKPEKTLAVAHEWAKSVAGTDKGGFAGPGQHDGEDYAFRVRFFVPKPPPPKKERPKPKPIEDEEALDLTDMVETDALESVRRVPGAEPLVKKKKKRKRKRRSGQTGEMKALKRKKRSTGEIPLSDTGEIRRRKKKKRKKKRRPTAEMPVVQAKAAEEQAEKTVRSDAGEATVRSDTDDAPTEGTPAEAVEEAAASAEQDATAAARAKAEQAKAKAAAARAAAAKAEADAARAAAEAAAEAARAAAAAEEKAAAERAAAEKAEQERIAAEKRAAEEKAAAEKKAAEEKAAAEKKAAEEKAAAEKAAAEKAAAEKKAAEKKAAEKKAAEKKAAEEKAAAEKKAAEDAKKKAEMTEQVVAMKAVSGQAPERGQKAVTAKTRMISREESKKAVAAADKSALGKAPAKKGGGNGALIGALVVLIAVAGFFGWALMNRDKDAGPAPTPEAPKTVRLSQDLRLAAYATGEGAAGDAVARAVAGYGSLNISSPGDVKDAAVRDKLAQVADAFEAECTGSKRFDACDGWARATYALYAGCAAASCDGKQTGELIQESIKATNLALTNARGLTDSAKAAATRLLVAHAIRLGSQNQKLVAAQAPQVAALGKQSCSGAAASSPDCQALLKSQ